MPYGFTGGGLPPNIHTFAVASFDNQTPTPQLPKELTDALRTRVRDRLGLRDATETKANALIRGTIQRYEIDIPVGYSASNKQQTTATRSLELRVDIEMIDQLSGKTLWQKKGALATVSYQEGGEPAARKHAIDQIVDELIEGAQSQW
ncbi:MAG: DUF4136 domain-containing protein [Gemmatimonadota bacterium]|nr:DUF4136 domain-containing protein [Gemmatimonadota bacterium]